MGGWVRGWWGGSGALGLFNPAALRDAGRRARCSTGCAMPGAAALHQWLHSAAPPGPGGGKAELEEMDCGCEGMKKGTQPWIRSERELWHGGGQMTK